MIDWEKEIKSLKKRLISLVERMVIEFGTIAFSRGEADADYGYKVNPDFSVEGIGEYQESAYTLEELNIVDLVDLIWVNRDEENRKEMREWCL